MKNLDYYFGDVATKSVGTKKVSKTRKRTFCELWKRF